MSTTRRNWLLTVVLLLFAGTSLLIKVGYGPADTAGATPTTIDCIKQPNQHEGWVFSDHKDQEVPPDKMPANAGQPGSGVEAGCVNDVPVADPSHRWVDLFAQVGDNPNYWTCFQQVTGHTKAEAEWARELEKQGWNEQVDWFRNAADSEHDSLFVQFNPGQPTDPDIVRGGSFTNTQGLGNGGCSTFPDTRPQSRLALTLPGPDKNTPGVPVVLEGCTNPIAEEQAGKPPVAVVPGPPGTPATVVTQPTPSTAPPGHPTTVPPTTAPPGHPTTVPPTTVPPTTVPPTTTPPCTNFNTSTGKCDDGAAGNPDDTTVQGPSSGPASGPHTDPQPDPPAPPPAPPSTSPPPTTAPGETAPPPTQPAPPTPDPGPPDTQPTQTCDNPNCY